MSIPAEDRLQMAVEAADLGTWNLELPSNSLQWCDRCKEIFGIPRDSQFSYARFLEHLHPEDCHRVAAIVQQALDPQGTGRYETEYRVIRPDGETRWVAAKGRAYFEQQHNGARKAVRFLGTLLDQTDQKHLQEALLHSEKLAVTACLAASIAHEIRNPLESIGNLLHLLRTETNEEVRLGYLGIAESELQKVSEIATNTLHFYRDPAGRAMVDLADLVESALMLFQGRITTQKVRVERRLAKGICVRAAEGELRQVIVNLISNALDAMPHGGVLALRTHQFPRGADGKYGARFTIADTGHGMSSKVKSRIFDAFYTTKGQAGNGVGLWLSLEIVKKHNAQMLVKSSLVRGTAFVVSFPAHNSAPAS